MGPFKIADRTVLAYGELKVDRNPTHENTRAWRKKLLCNNAENLIF